MKAIMLEPATLGYGHPVFVAGVEYRAVPATNQPDHQAKGLYFLEHDAGGEILLSAHDGSFYLVDDSTVDRLLPEVAELYREDAWGEHTGFTREEWASAAALGDTQLGYWEWVSQQVSSSMETTH